MSVLDQIGKVLKPVSELVDNLHTSKEEKLQIKQKIKDAENTLYVQVLEMDARLHQMRAQAIEAESKGDSWLQRNWRPVTMVTFLILIICDAFGFLQYRLAEQSWTLLQIGLGGYVIGRSAEKTVKSLRDKV